MFFTVVIPTRNRPELAAIALRSVLGQDFQDFEVVVSDNSGEEDAGRLRAEVAKAADDRVRYVRPPGELDMGEHWEFAVGQARGEYVGYLTDRMAFRRDALSILHGEITARGSEVVSYSSSGILEVQSPYRLQRPPFSGRTETFRSDWVVSLLAHSVAPWGAPCMLNSFASRQLIAAMTSVYGTLMASIAPDAAFCVHVLDHVDRFDYVDRPLMVSFGHAWSNGAGFGSGQLNDSSREFAQRVARRGGLPFAPIPEIVNNLNIRANEYGRMRSEQRSGRFVELDIRSYCDELAAELQLQGTKATSEDWSRLEDFMRAHGVARANVIPERSRLKRLAQPVLLAASDWLGINPLNRPVGRFATVEGALRYDEAHTPRPNSKQSGFLRDRDRARLAAAGVGLS
ncbi:MAG TPA: glycosyltransferase family A protein [Candidatus Dormibacteraeota bacterium]|nr:glycosyltransferase family A protein [Candidatus Dormibacteraeota bacterium]